VFPEIGIPSLPFAGCYGVAVKSLSVVERLLRENGIQTRTAGEYLVAVFPGALGRGAWLFVEKAQISLFR
jgi:hypothetical protein